MHLHFGPRFAQSRLGRKRDLTVINPGQLRSTPEHYLGQRHGALEHFNFDLPSI